jgi:hypothetical protein
MRCRIAFGQWCCGPEALFQGLKPDRFWLRFAASLKRCPDTNLWFCRIFQQVVKSCPDTKLKSISLAYHPQPPPQRAQIALWGPREENVWGPVRSRMTAHAKSGTTVGSSLSERPSMQPRSRLVSPQPRRPAVLWSQYFRVCAGLTAATRGPCRWERGLPCGCRGELLLSGRAG